MAHEGRSIPAHPCSREGRGCAGTAASAAKPSQVVQAQQACLPSAPLWPVPSTGRPGMPRKHASRYALSM